MDEKVFKIEADGQQALTSIKDIRQALKQVKDEMANVEAGSDAWLKLANKAGEYKHQLDEINESVRGASADFGDIVGNISNVGAGITGAFQTAKAAMSMFGVESEEVLKTIKQMQNLMAITQGLASIDKAIKSFRKLATVIKTSATAMKVLNTLMTPKVLLPVAAAIALIAANWDKVKEAITGVNKEEEKRNAEINKSVDGYNKKLEDRLTLEEKIRKLAGQDEVEIAKARIETIKQEISKKETLLSKARSETAIAAANLKQAKDKELTQGAINAYQQKYNKRKDEETKLEKEIAKLKNKQLKDAKEALKLAEQEEKAREIARKKEYDEGANERKSSSELKRLEIRLKITKDTVEYFKVLKQIYNIHVRDLAIFQKEAKALSDKVKAGQADVETLKKRDAAQKKVQDTQLKILETQDKLYDSYSKFFSGRNNLQEMNDAWEKMKDDFEKMYHIAKKGKDEDIFTLIGERDVVKYKKVVEKIKSAYNYEDNGDPAPKYNQMIEKLVKYTEKEQATFAQYLGITQKQLEELYLTIINKRIELQRLAKQAAGEELTQLDALKGSLEDNKVALQALVDTYGSAATSSSEYMQLQIKQANIQKSIFDEEEKYAKMQRQLAGEKEGSVEAINAEYADVEAHMNKLVDTFGVEIQETEEYIQLNLRLLQLFNDLKTATMEQHQLSYEKRMLDVENAQADVWQTTGELEYLNEKKRLEEELLGVVKQLYGAESIQYKQQLANLKETKKALIDVKLASVQVASQGLGFIADMLGSIADTVDTSTKEGFEQQKKLAIGQTVMNGIAGTINAITSWMSPANAWMTAPVQAVMAGLESAAIAAATAAQVEAIGRTNFEGNGSMSTGALSNLTLLPPVEYTNAVQGASIEENTANAKSYVAVTEIQEVSERVNVAEAESKY